MTGSKPPIPVWSTLLLNCGLERWEVLGLAQMNQGEADKAFVSARHWRLPLENAYGFPTRSRDNYFIKKAVWLERLGRQRSERAQQLRKLAEKIPDK